MSKLIKGWKKMKLKKLNLGCGKYYKKGWVNADFNDDRKVDDCFDMTKFPFPYKDNTFDVVYTRMTFEHIHNPAEVLNEIYRILKPNGYVEIITVHFSSACAFIGDIHISTFSRLFWTAFTNETYYPDWSYKVKVRYSSLQMRIRFAKGLQFWNRIIEPIVNINRKVQRIYEETGLRNIFPADEVHIKLYK